MPQENDTLKVAIVEDAIADKDVLQEALQRFGEEKSLEVQITWFDRAIRFLESNNANFEIVFMDIEIPDMNGMEAARKLRKENQDVVLVYVTNLAKYAVLGYETGASAYILKPVNYNAFSFKMAKIYDLVLSKRKGKFLIQFGNKTLVSPVNNIIYVEVMKHKLIIHTIEGDFETWKMTMAGVSKQLIPFGFSLCNACYLVNLQFVNSIMDDEVIVKGIPLKISAKRKKQFKEDLMSYIYRN